MHRYTGDQHGSITHPGLVREINEDCLGFYRAGDAVLAVLADGIGGHNAGEVASRICVETLRDVFLGSDGGNPENILRKGLLEAGENILRQGSADINLHGMGTTVVAAVIRGRQCWYSHLGDSRIYLLLPDRVERLTRDHSVPQELLDRGLITERQAKGHRMAHVITKALGLPGITDADIQVRTIALPEESGLLLCSDGLTDLVSDDEIYREVIGRKPQKACDDLLELVLARGAHDNVSIQILSTGR